MADTNTNVEASSHKGQKINSYTTGFKIDAIQYAEIHNNTSAARKFNVANKRIRDWRKKKSKVFSLVAKVKGQERKRLEGAGRKVMSIELEETVLEWIHDRRAKALRVSRKLIMKKAKIIHKEITKDKPDAERFAASNGCLYKFMKRNGLSLRGKTSIFQKDPEQLIEKLVSYIIQVRRLTTKFKYAELNIIAMDEKPIWSDMISETTIDITGKSEIQVKSTGHEKSRVTVCLTAKANGVKMKWTNVFKGGKREVTREELKQQAVIATSGNGWMDSTLTHEWVESVLGKFSFSRRLLAWDSYQCHIANDLKTLLNTYKVNQVIVPGGCTKHIQAPDVSWNKPFKAHCTEKYDEWMDVNNWNKQADESRQFESGW